MAMSDFNPFTGLRRTPLWKEITLMLVIKAVALYLIWFAFFSAPVDKQLDAAGIASSLLKPDSQSTSSTSKQEIGHAARPGTR